MSTAKISRRCLAIINHPHQSGPVKRRKIWHEICKGSLKVKPLIRAKYPKKRICRELAVVWTSDENPHQS